MPKFMEIDLLDSLEKIMKKNTRSYQGDFSYDRKDLEEAAAKADTLPLRERTYLWMSRCCGTWCLIGNLYPLDYREHVELVKRMSVPADQVRIVHEKGAYFQDLDKRVHKGEHKLFGKFLYSEYVPNDSGALETVLRQEEWKRMKMRCGKVENHIRNIRKSAA